jgi:uncharacterized repeat protein (TIGR01451 family)
VYDGTGLNLVALAPFGADLEIEKSSSEDPVAADSDLTYAIVVTNHWPDTSTSAVLTDVLPTGVAFSSASSGCNEAGGTVSCDIGALSPSASTTVSILVAVCATTTGILTNTAGVSATEFDHVDANNAASATTRVIAAGAVAVKVLLVVGFDLVSVPVDCASPMSARDLADLISAQGGVVDSVQRWGVGGAQGFDGWLPGSPNPFTVEPDQGYFVKVSAVPANSEVSITGLPFPRCRVQPHRPALYVPARRPRRRDFDDLDRERGRQSRLNSTLGSRRCSGVRRLAAE